MKRSITELAGAVTELHEGFDPIYSGSSKGHINERSFERSPSLTAVKWRSRCGCNGYGYFQ